MLWWKTGPASYMNKKTICWNVLTRRPSVRSVRFEKWHCFATFLKMTLAEHRNFVTPNICCLQERFSIGRAWPHTHSTPCLMAGWFFSRSSTTVNVRSCVFYFLVIFLDFRSVASEQQWYTCTTRKPWWRVRCAHFLPTNFDQWWKNSHSWQ